MNKLYLLGDSIPLFKLPQSEERGLWLSLLSSFDIYKFSIVDRDMLLLIGKQEMEYTPMQRRKIAERVQQAKGVSCVFYFDYLPTNERDRLVKQGVYFIVSYKFAYLPTILMNRKMGLRNYGARLRPAAQYLLLYHLQKESINGRSLRELADVIPYQYATIANSVRQLCDVGLIKVSVGQNKSKRIVILSDNKDLWQKAMEVMISPIERLVYADAAIDVGIIGGISALSMYSMLSPERIPTRVLTKEEFHTLTAQGVKTFPTPDLQRIEVWHYPPLQADGVVDKLSLALTLQDDHDPRVEKELEQMMRTVW